MTSTRLPKTITAGALLATPGGQKISTDVMLATNHLLTLHNSPNLWQWDFCIDNPA